MKYLYISLVFIAYSFFFSPIPAHAEYSLYDPNADQNLDLKAPEKSIIDHETYLSDQKQLEVIYSYTTHEVPADTGELYEQRTENAKTYKISENLLNNTTVFKTNFYPGKPFKKEKDIWLQVETATTTLEAWNEQTAEPLTKIKDWFIGTAYADSYYANAGGDGSVYRQSNTSWADSRTGDGTSMAEAATTSYIGNEGAGGGTIFITRRGFFPIDTSSLDDNATINSATFNFYTDNCEQNYGGSPIYVDLFLSTQADPSSLALADYSKLTVDSPTSLITERKACVSNQYNETTLNATGEAAINLTGYTKLVLRTDFDIDNLMSGGGYREFTVHNTEYANATSDPYLSIDWEVGSTPPVFSIATSTDIMNIESIYYIATTTAISSTTSTTVAEYKIPFLLYLFVLLSLSFTILILIFFKSLIDKKR
jgi:hypothetical protein